MSKRIECYIGEDKYDFPVREMDGEEFIAIGRKNYPLEFIKFLAHGVIVYEETEAIVKDRNGRNVFFFAAAPHMDDDLCEVIHKNYPGVGYQRFFELYATAHLLRFDEEWAPFYGGAW